MLKQFLAGIFIVASAGGATAGPFEEGLAAKDRGNYATAVLWLRPLAEQDDARAQYTLGILYNRGWGVPQDLVEVEIWWRKSAELGNTAALHDLAAFYAESMNYAQAAKWIRKAAEQCDITAQMRLGQMYDGLAPVSWRVEVLGSWYLV